MGRLRRDCRGQSALLDAGLAFVLLTVGSAVVWTAAVRSVALQSDTGDLPRSGQDIGAIHRLILSSTVPVATTPRDAYGNATAVRNATVEGIWRLVFLTLTEDREAGEDDNDRLRGLLDPVARQYAIGFRGNAFLVIATGSSELRIGSTRPPAELDRITGARLTDYVTVGAGDERGELLLVVW